jgi:hypothetical protein
VKKSPRQICIGCDAAWPGTHTGPGIRWRLCKVCRGNWSSSDSIGFLDKPLPLESDPDFKLILRVAASLKVNVFDALAERCLLAQGNIEAYLETAHRVRRFLGSRGIKHVIGADMGKRAGLSPKVFRDVLTLSYVEEVERRKGDPAFKKRDAEFTKLYLDPSDSPRALHARARRLMAKKTPP